MTDKLFSVIDTIVGNPNRIEEIVKSGNEYYFRYGGHFFSVAKVRGGGEESLSVYIYPRWSGTIAELEKALDPFNEKDVPMVAYHDDDLPEQKRRLFRDLYSTIEGKHLGVDDVFDDILGF